MKSILERFKKCNVGAYFVFFTLLCSLLSFIFCLVGIASGYQSWLTFVCFILILVADVVLFVFNKLEFAPAVNAILSALGIGFFIYAGYNYVATVITGIDIENFSADFILSCVFYVLAYASSVASIFLPLYKKAKTESTDKVTEQELIIYEKKIYCQ